MTSGRTEWRGVSHCPQCQVEVRPDAQTGQAPSFCLHCRFPLMLVGGKYQLHRILGEGGFATVYEAHHAFEPNAPRCVAKILKPELMAEPGMKARFTREVEVTLRLSRNSHHVVWIYDEYGEIPQLGVYYFMEFLDGKPLSQRIEETGGLLPLASCYDFFGQLCEAMDVAHREGVVHRDLKPDNLFLIQHDQAHEWLKVIDFGIARPLGTEKAVTKLTQGVLGTPAYMAPELYMNQTVGPHTDIYAMGIILYELLVGHTPYAPPHLPPPTAASFMTSHVMGEIPSLMEALPAGRVVPEGLESLIHKALAKQPAERFDSVAAMAEALRHAIAGHPGADAFLGPLPPEGSVMADSPSSEMYASLSAGYATDDATVIQPNPTLAASFSTAASESQPEVVVTPMPGALADAVPSDYDSISTHRDGVSRAAREEHDREGFGGVMVASEFQTSQNEGIQPAPGDVMLDPRLAAGPVLSVAAPMADGPMTYEELPSIRNGTTDPNVVVTPMPRSDVGDLILQSMSAPTTPEPQLTHGAMAPSATMRERAPSPRKPLLLWLSVGAVGCVLLAMLWWALGPSSSDPDPAPGSRPPTRQAALPDQPGVGQRDPQPQPSQAMQRPAPRPRVLQIPNWPKQPKARPRPRRRTQRRTYRRRRRRRRSRRYAPHCPRRNRLHWIYLTFARHSRSRVLVKFRGSGRSRTRRVRRRRGLCLGVSNPSMRVILSVKGKQRLYDSCSFTFSRYAPRARVKFNRREGDIVSIAPDRCLKKR